MLSFLHMVQTLANGQNMICLMKNPDKRGKRDYVRSLNARLIKKSPYIYGTVKRKYIVFSLLNRLHVSEDSFRKALRWSKRTLNVDKLYND